ncbi:MAG: SPOR domain-containing protein [Planctomycetota bacterium]
MPTLRSDPTLNPQRLHLLRATAFAVAMTAVAFVVSCGPKPEANLAAATGAYGRRDYAKAAEQAALAAQSTNPAERAKARYLEGLALLQLGRLDAAADALRLATDASDRRIAADARISLGTAEIRRGNHELAAQAYKRAALLLEGDEARRAHSIAARCFDHAGMSKAAEDERVLAGEPRVLVAAAPQPASAPQPAPAASAPPAPTARIVNGIEVEPIHFAIQAGAFKERVRARELADSLRAKPAAQKLGAPRIIEKERDGATLFVVQLGDFPNRAVAGKAMITLGIGTYTVERYLE